MPITFEKIMNFYPEHNSSVYSELKELIKNHSLIPFVGAGLSAFCGYPSWPNALNILSNRIIDENEKEGIKERIQNNDLLSAAQEIYDLLSPVNMLSEMQHLFKIDYIQNCPQNKMELSAAYMIPILFKDSPVMTTNFDTVLENIYSNQNKAFERVISPHEPDLLTQLRQNNAQGLFKLHGSINKKIISFNDLVFTKTQYQQAYSNDGALKNELMHWFEDKQLIFLGCSLSIDETMKLLQSIVEKNPTVKHYAIISCKKEDMSMRIREIGKMGIRAIFYPDGKYDSVRIILERLLEECNPNEYQQLPCYITDEKETENNDVKPFLYDSNFISFFGRKTETQELERFCQNEKRICWWAVTGPGGIGKSRLVYEFIKKKEKDGWKTTWLKPYQYNTLDHFEPSVNKSIIVADDVQAKLKQIGDWMQRICDKRRSEKLRLILLERDGNDLSNATWGETLQNGEEQDSIHKQLCYKEDFLNLTSLTKEDLKNIIFEYVEKSGKSLTDDNAENLLKSLETVDPELCRPLYAIAIADAFCEKKNPTRWDKKKLLKYVSDREINFYIYRLRDLLDGKRSIPEVELKQLLITSCIYGMIPLDQVIELMPTEWPQLSKKADDLDLPIEDFLKQIGVVHELSYHNTDSNETEFIEAVILECPDLVKEYIVLQNTVDKNHFDTLFPFDWENNPPYLIFFLRILKDYPEKLENQPAFWEKYFSSTPDNKFCQSIYVHFLLGVSVKIPELSQKAVDVIEELSNCITDVRFVELYASVLLNLSSHQPIEDCQKTIKKLEVLHKSFNTSDEIASSYAKSLFNLSSIQQSEDCKTTIKKLRNLKNLFGENENIAEVYADSLLCFCIEKELEDCQKIAKEIEIVHNTFITNKNIAITYAITLLKLSTEQPFKDCQKTAEKLKKLHKLFNTNERIALIYAGVLELLSTELELNICKKVVKELKLLYKAFDANEDIAKTYSSGLVNLSFTQPSETEIQQTLRDSYSLLTLFSNDEEFQLSYAKTWFNLTLKQSGEVLITTLAELRDYLLEHISINQQFQEALDEYLKNHPEHVEQYEPLRLNV